MTLPMIVSLIMAMAPVFHLDPKVALAVASVESGLNPKVTGQAGEIGLFQVMPSVGLSKGYTRNKLKDPLTNIFVGLQLLEEAKNNCVHKTGLTYLICYNYGRENAKKIKHPQEFPYVKKVKKQVANNEKRFK